MRRAAPDPPATRALRVGLLGGSFNPAHEGHRHLSLEALKRLRLDRVWWLVSPQNPLKTTRGMAPLAERLASARGVIAGHPSMLATDLEARLGTRYTADTLARLKAMPGRRFVWLIGSDNLLQLPKWKHWRRIFYGCAIAVFDRDPYSYSALDGEAAHAFNSRRVEADLAGELMDRPLPAWTYLRVARHPASSTAIRRKRTAPLPPPQPPSERSRAS